MFRRINTSSPIAVDDGIKKSDKSVIKYHHHNHHRDPYHNSNSGSGYRNNNDNSNSNSNSGNNNNKGGRLEKRQKQSLFSRIKSKLTKRNLLMTEIMEYHHYNGNNQRMESRLKKPLISNPEIGLPSSSILDYYLEEDSIPHVDPLLQYQQSYMKILASIIQDFMISSNLDEPDHVFSTIPAIFYHEHNLYDQLLKQNIGYILEFINESKLDYAAFMYMYPTFISYKIKGADIRTAKKRFDDSHLTFGKMMGRVYCRIDNLKRLLPLSKYFISLSHPSSISPFFNSSDFKNDNGNGNGNGIHSSTINDSSSFADTKIIQASIGQFELEFKELLSVRHQEITFLEAIMDCENAAGNHDKIISTFHIPFDRQQDLLTTIQQMKLDYSIRYQQAVRHADYQKDGSIKVHKKKQYCLTIFTRHIVLLEIVLNSANGSWKYRLNSKEEHSIRQLDEVVLEDYRKDDNIIMVRFIYPIQSLILIECAGIREKRELLSSFAILQKEAIDQSATTIAMNENDTNEMVGEVL